MDGDEQIALDLVTAYRGVLGGIGVAVSSTVINNMNKNQKLFSFRSFLRTSPLILTVPMLMIGIRRATVYFNPEEEEKEA